MNRRLAPLPALAVAVSAACAASPAPDASQASTTYLDYVVRIEDPAAEQLEVELTLAGLPADEESLMLFLPERFAFVGLDAPLLAGPPEARDGDGRPLTVEGETPFRWRVTHDGASEVHVDLAVPLTHREIPAVRDRDCYEFPYLAADHGMLVAGSMLLAPEGFESRARARLRFALPAGWAVHCPWPEVEPGVYEPDDPGSLVSDLFAVGAWEERVIDANGCEITVAVAPGQGDLIEKVGGPIERIVHAEIDLFGCVPREKYLFLFGRPDPPPTPGERGLGLGGSPKTGSMTLVVRAVGMAFDAARQIGHLIAHEFHHTWANPHVALPDELRFVGEGFTDYYAYLVLAREEMTSWEEFGRTLQKKLHDYLANPTRGELSLAEAGGPAFFQGRDAYSHVYDGGTLFAALVDRYIRAVGDGRSLDEAMRAFYNDPRWRNAEAKPGFDDFFAVLGDFLAAEEVAFLADLARAPEGIDFAQLLSATGASVTVALAPAPLSLRANLDGTRIRDIDPGGLGGRLGLQAGDVLLEVNGTPCDGPDQVQRAWRAATGGRIRFVFERAGERHEVDEPVPDEATVTVDATPWRAHVATATDR